MSNPVYTRRPAETLVRRAGRVALDLRWSFNHAADAVWQRLDPALWDLTHNPWFVLQSVSRERLEAVTRRRRVQQLSTSSFARSDTLTSRRRWFQQVHPRAPFSAVAYFSMEFMLSEALPIYSGGLGNVAGDQLKTASNLACRSSASGCSTSRVISGRTSTRAGDSRRCIRSTIRASFRFGRCARRTENGYGSQFRFQAPRCGFAPGRRRSRARLYVLDTNDRRTPRRIVASPASCTAAKGSFG